MSSPQSKFMSGLGENLELTKPRITCFILMSAAIGFLCAEHLVGSFSWLVLLHTLFGTALLASDLNLLHTIPLGFSPKSLNCAAHAARAPVRRDFYEFPRLEMVAGVPSNLVR